MQALLDAALGEGGREATNQMEEEEEGEAGSVGCDLNHQQQQQGLTASASVSGGGTADHQTSPGAACNVFELLELVHLIKHSRTVMPKRAQRTSLIKRVWDTIR